MEPTTEEVVKKVKDYIDNSSVDKLLSQYTHLRQGGHEVLDKYIRGSELSLHQKVFLLNGLVSTISSLFLSNREGYRVYYKEFLSFFVVKELEKLPPELLDLFYCYSFRFPLNNTFSIRSRVKDYLYLGSFSSNTKKPLDKELAENTYGLFFILNSEQNTYVNKEFLDSLGVELLHKTKNRNYGLNRTVDLYFYGSKPKKEHTNHTLVLDVEPLSCCGVTSADHQRPMRHLPFVSQEIPKDHEKFVAKILGNGLYYNIPRVLYEKNPINDKELPDADL